MTKRYISFLAAVSIIVGVSYSSMAQKSKKKASEKTEVTQQKADEISEEQKSEFEYLFIEGLKQRMTGNLQNAISVFSRCLEIDPNSAVAMFELANIHLANNDLTSASLLLEKAIHINPGNKWYKQLLAQIYQQTKKYDKAAELYRDLSEKEPENQEYLYMYASMLGSAKKYDEAIAAYNKLEKQIGINEQISVEKQQVYQAAGKKKEAFAELQRLIDSNPSEPRYYGLMADLYLSEKDQENALKYYNKILEIDPSNGFVHFSLASLYQMQDKPEKAFEETKIAFGSKDLEVDTKIQFYLMLTANPEQKDLTDDQIGELVRILVKTNPDDYRVYSVYAEYLLRKGDLKEAREQLRKVLAEDNGNFEIWQRIILISNDLQDFKRVYDDCNEAIELFPNQPILYGLKAVACLQLDKYEESLKTLEEGEPYILGNKPLRVQFELYKAEANYKLDRVQDAFKAFDEVIRQDPENYMAMNNYAYYLSLRNENLDKAEQMSSKAVRANPDNSTYLDTYAWVLFKQKNYSLAKFYIESALKNGGDQNGVIVEHYGDILYMLGDKGKAVDQWKKARELGDASELISEKIKQERYFEK
jgi:tetratricopeptide (TPR) repeat protein